MSCSSLTPFKGKYKDCHCFWPGKVFTQPFFQEWAEIEEMLGTVSTQLSVEGDPQGDSTGLPESLFRGGIYDKFCEELDGDMGRALTLVVDHEGNEIQPKVRRDGSQPWLPRAHRPRSPPVKPDDYEGYVIELKWEPTENGGACPETCEESLLRVSNSQCKSITTQFREAGGVLHSGRRIGRILYVICPPAWLCSSAC